MKQFASIFFKMSGSILEIYLKDCNKWQKFPPIRYLSLKVFVTSPVENNDVDEQEITIAADALPHLPAA